jgi:hypothetical protein
MYIYRIQCIKNKIQKSGGLLCRTTGVGLKRLGDGVAASVLQRGCLLNFRLEGV